MPVAKDGIVISALIEHDTVYQSHSEEKSVN